MRKLSLVLSVLALFFSVHHAVADDFTYEDLVQLIQKSHVASVDALLPLLPAELRSNYTLMHESRSLQQGTYQNPRVILFGRNAKLTCAFNGDPSEMGYDSFECFQFRSKERKFDFRQIQFPTESNGLRHVLFSRSNQTADGKISCTACHGGSDPRPNWDDYNQWKGAYGFDDDELDFEAPNYAAFVAKRATHPRYRWLIQGDKPADPYGDLADIGHRPNLRFSDLVGRWNSLRATRILESKVPSWQVLAFAVGALSCQPTAEQMAAFDKAGLNFSADTDLAGILDKIGMSPNQWTTQIFNDPMNEPGTLVWEHQSGYSFLTEDVAMAIAQEKARTGDVVLQKAIERILKNYGSGYPEGPTQQFFADLNAIVPDVDHFSNQWQPNRELVCPELMKLFVKEYLNKRLSAH